VDRIGDVANKVTYFQPGCLKLVSFAFNVVDLFYPHIDRRIKSFGIKHPAEFLGELKRVAKKDDLLDDDHQPPKVTKKNILESGHWVIWEETRDRLKYESCE
jgi:hypothetical protein